MKIVIRIFNVVIMAISLAAAILLLAVPTITFKSRLSLNVETFSEFVPTTEYSDEFKISEMLGTETINLGINFSIYPGDAPKLMSGDKETINNALIEKNANEMLDTLRTPIELITDFAIRAVIRKTVEKEITTQIENARDEMHSASSAQDIMDDAGLDDAYFAHFADALYDAANKKGATVDSTGEVLYAQVDDALAKAEEFGASNTAEFTEKREEIKENMVKILSDLNLVNPDGTLKPISQISFIYIAEHFKGELINAGYDPAPLAQRADEETPDYADRILITYLYSIIPDGFYSGAGTVSTIIFISIFVFVILWGLLFLITLLRTISKKPWTLFGPWFWIIGLLQVVVGIGLTAFIKLYLPTLAPSLEMGPISGFAVALRTCTLIPSILYLVCLAIAIPYLVLKIMAKHQHREELAMEDEEEDE